MGRVRYRQGIEFPGAAARPPVSCPLFGAMLASPLSMRIPRLVLAAMLWAWLCAPAAAEEARIVVLHTTDLHGALTPYDYLAGRPAARGLVKLATLVEAVRAEKLPTLLLDGGDCIEGSPLVTVYRHG